MHTDHIGVSLPEETPGPDPTQRERQPGGPGRVPNVLVLTPACPTDRPATPSSLSSRSNETASRARLGASTAFGCIVHITGRLCMTVIQDTFLCHGGDMDGRDRGGRVR